MTAKELIAELQNLDGDLPVWIDICRTYEQVNEVQEYVSPKKEERYALICHECPDYHRQSIDDRHLWVAVGVGVIVALAIIAQAAGWVTIQ